MAAAGGAVERWAFVADWTDPSNGVRWTYQLFAYLVPGAPLEVEMFDIKNKRHFLKRVKCSTVELAQLYVGSTITVFSRQLLIIAYGDEASRRAVEARSQRTLALILPDAVQHTGQIMNAIYSSGFSIINLRMCQMSAADACRLLSTQQGDPALAPHLASGPVVAMELMAASGIRKWLDQADSIRGLLGTNAVLASDSPDSAAEELAIFFGSSRGSSKPSIAGSTQGSMAWGTMESVSSSAGGRGTCASASAGGCGQSQVTSCCRGYGTTLGLVLPHAVKDGVAGLLLEEIQAGFDVTGLQLFNLPKQVAAEVLEVYKGVVPPGEFSTMVDELASGPCIAVEVATRDGVTEPVEAFRQLVGPVDPELARVLRPHTLRARFGAGRVRKAIHCTDLAEDGPLETSYFFSVLQQPYAAAALAH